MTVSTQGAVKEVVSQFPELAGVLEEHIRDNFGELLPHLFFWDMYRWADTEVEGRRARVEDLIGLVDRLYETGDSDVQNLVVVSFLENIHRDSPLFNIALPLRTSVNRDLGNLPGS